MLGLIKRIVGTKNDREIKRIRPYVDVINKLEADLQQLSDEALRAKTEEFKKRIRDATDASRQALEALQAEVSTADSERREELKAQIEE